MGASTWARAQSCALGRSFVGAFPRRRRGRARRWRGGVRLVVVHLVVVPAVGRAARVVVVVGRGTTVVRFEARSATFGRGAGRRARTREGARGGRRREVDA